MSFDHKAFAFDWDSFQREMAGVLSRALITGDASGLERFVESNLSTCTSPYDGGRLGSNWRRCLGMAGLQEVADFALTKYYDPSQDQGLHEAWADIDSGLPVEGKVALLGMPFGERADRLFDPGLMGSYFQTPERVRASLATLRSVGASELEGYTRFLATVVSAAKGLYVTF
jgi:hypothetical protein